MIPAGCSRMSDTEDSAPILSFEEARVLGCLMEKEITTPDYYYIFA